MQNLRYIIAYCCFVSGLLHSQIVAVPTVPTESMLEEDQELIWKQDIPNSVWQTLIENGEDIFEVLSLTDFEAFKKVEFQNDSLKEALFYLAWHRLRRLYGDDPLEWTYYIDHNFDAQKIPYQNWLAWKEDLIAKRKSNRPVYVVNNAEGRTPVDERMEQYKTWFLELKSICDFTKLRQCDASLLWAVSPAGQRWMQRIALTEIMEHSRFFKNPSSSAFNLAQSLKKLKESYLKLYVPYEKAEIDIFKSYAYREKGRGNDLEFETIWIDRQMDNLLNLEPVGIGLVSTGRDSSPTPSGNYKIFGFNSRWKNIGDDRMPGAVLLSKDGDTSYSSRALHGTAGYGYGQFGYNKSHGCIRQYTNEGDQTSLVDVIWGAINPKALDGVDHIDGYESWRLETPLLRFVMQEIRDRVEVKVFGGSRSTLTVDQEVLTRHQNKLADVLGESLVSLTQKLESKDNTIQEPENPDNLRRGQYRVFDYPTQVKMFQTPIPRSKYY